jgi:hypothetical protein
MRARKRTRFGSGSTEGIAQRRTQMSIDLSKLSPAPWTHVGFGRVMGATAEDGSCMEIYPEGGHSEDDAEFIARARNAFDVMTRRKWTPIFSTLGWYVLNADFELAMDLPEDDPGIFFGDAFTAVVESERWLIERESTHKES